MGTGRAGVSIWASAALIKFTCLEEAEVTTNERPPEAPYFDHSSVGLILAGSLNVLATPREGGLARSGWLRR